MNCRPVAAAILLLFAAFTGACFWFEGIDGIWPGAARNATALQIFVDLVIAMAFWWGWVIRDAPRSGPLWVVLGLVAGSLAPLLYTVVYGRWPGSSVSSLETSAPVRIGGAVVAVPFAILTVAAIAMDGPNVPATVVGSWWSLQIFVDLVIAIGFWAGWMLVDARRRGASPWGWLIYAVVLGSFSPLTYLILLRRHPQTET